MDPQVAQPFSPWQLIQKYQEVFLGALKDYYLFFLPEKGLQRKFNDTSYFLTVIVISIFIKLIVATISSPKL